MTSETENQASWQAVRNQCMKSLFWHDTEGWKSRTEALAAIFRHHEAPSSPVQREAEGLVERLREAADDERDSALEQDFWHEDLLREAIAGLASRDTELAALRRELEVAGGICQELLAPLEMAARELQARGASVDETAHEVFARARELVARALSTKGADHAKQG